MRLWDERGFGNVTAADICTAADVTQGAFFRDVKSMSELGVLAAAAILPIRNFADELILFQGSTFEFLDRAIERISEAFAGREALLLAVLRKELGHNAVWADDDGAVQVIRWALARGQARGEIDPMVSVETSATALLSVMVGSVAQSCALGHDLDTTLATIRRRARFVLENLQPQQPTASGTTQEPGHHE